MHSYASDSIFRSPKIYFAFGFVAVASASAIKALPSISPHLGFNTGALSAGVMYGLVVFTYDRWLWRWLSNIPHLHGTWVGVINSSHNGGSSVECVVHISQTWSRLRVELETSTSKSYTTMAALFQDQSGDRGLKYEFIREPKGRAVNTLQMTRGVCNLGLPDNADQLHGNYYTGRGSMNHGEIRLKRISREHLGYESASSVAELKGPGSA